MQKKVVFLVIIFLLSLFAYGIYLLLVLTTSKEKLEKSNDVGIPVTGGKDVRAGEVALSKVTANPWIPYEQVSLNAVWIKDFRKYVGEDGTTPMVDVDLAFKVGGFKSYFTVTMVGEVAYQEFSYKDGKRLIEHEGTRSVVSIPFVKGEQPTIVLAYFPDGESEGRKKLLSFCEIEKNSVCTTYPSLGFGNTTSGPNTFKLELIDDGKKFLPDQVAVSTFIRNMTLPKIEE